MFLVFRYATGMCFFSPTGSMDQWIAFQSSPPHASVILSLVRVLPSVQVCAFAFIILPVADKSFLCKKICMRLLDSCDCSVGTIRRSFSTSSAIATQKETSRRSPVSRCVSSPRRPHFSFLHQAFSFILIPCSSGRINTDKRQWY